MPPWGWSADNISYDTKCDNFVHPQEFPVDNKGTMNKTVMQQTIHDMAINALDRTIVSGDWASNQRSIVDNNPLFVLDAHMATTRSYNGQPISSLTLHKKPIYIPWRKVTMKRTWFIWQPFCLEGILLLLCWCLILCKDSMIKYVGQTDWLVISWNRTCNKVTIRLPPFCRHHVFIGTNFANSVHDTCHTPRWWRCTYTIGMKGNGYTIGLKGNVGRCRTDAGRHICQWEQLVVLMIFQQ